MFITTSTQTLRVNISSKLTVVNASDGGGSSARRLCSLSGAGGSSRKVTHRGPPLADAKQAGWGRRAGSGSSNGFLSVGAEPSSKASHRGLAASAAAEGFGRGAGRGSSMGFLS